VKSPEWPELDLPIVPPLAPMEARSANELPEGFGWQFEPKWDGLRCLAFRDCEAVALQSRTGQPLHGTFPEVASALVTLRPRKFVLDGEIVVESGRAFSRGALIRRSGAEVARARELAESIPATMLLFDLLVDPRGRDVTGRILAERRLALEELARAHLAPNRRLRLSPATTERWVVERWTGELIGRGVSGILAKRLDKPYMPGDRTAVFDIKLGNATGRAAPR
jgi:ATP-dependent DNA ligase